MIVSLRHWMKWILRGLGLVLLILIAYLVMFLFVRENFIQNWTVDRLSDVLSSSVGTELKIGDANLKFFDFIQIEEVYMEGADGDTFLFFENVFLDYSIKDLVIHRKLNIQAISINGAKVRLAQLQDGCTNVVFTDRSQEVYDSTKRVNDEPSFRFEPGRFKLKDIHFVNEKPWFGKTENFKLRKGTFKVAFSDFSKRFYFSKAEISGLSIQIETYDLNRAEERPICAKKPPFQPKPLDIRIRNFRIRDSHVDIANYLKEALDLDESELKYIDVNRLVINDISGAGGLFHFIGDSVRISDMSLAGMTSTGIPIKELSVDSFSLHNTQMTFEDLALRTDKSKLGYYLRFNYEDMRAFGDFDNKVNMYGVLRNTEVNVRDLLALSPNLRTNAMFLDHLDEDIDFTGIINGKVNDLRLQNFLVDFEGVFEGEGDLHVQHLRSARKNFYDFGLDWAELEAVDVLTYFGDEKWPPGFADLGKVSLSGNYFGKSSNWRADYRVQTELGDSDFDIYVDSRSENFAGDIGLQNFDLGTLLQEQDLGLITGELHVKDGQGFDIETLTARLNGSLDLFEYRDYRYQNAVFDGVLSRELFDGRFEIKDENIELAFEGEMNLDEGGSIFKFESSVIDLDLQKLGFTQRPMQFRGEFDFNLTGRKLDDLDGSVRIKSLMFDDGRKTVKNLDSVFVQFFSIDENNKRIEAISEEFNLKIAGQINMSSFLDQLKYQFWLSSPSLFQSMGFAQPAKPQRWKENDFDYKFDLKAADRVIRLFAPSLDTCTGLWAEGSYISDEYGVFETDMRAGLSALEDPKTKIINGELNLNAGSQGGVRELYYTSEQFDVSSFRLEDVDLTSGLDKDSVNLVLNIGSINGVADNYYLSGNAKFKDSMDFVAVLDSSGFVLLDERWSMRSDNKIEYKPQSLFVNNFVYSAAQSDLYVQSVTTNSLIAGNRNIKVDFLNEFLSNDNLELQGFVYTNIGVEDLFSLKGYELDVAIEGLRINEDVYDELDFTAYMYDFDQPTQISGTIRDSLGERLKLSGEVNLATEGGPSYELNADLDDLSLSTVEIFLGNLINNTKGTLASALKISGQGADYNLEGKVLIDGQTEFTLLGTNLVFDQQEVTMGKEELNFDGISVKDMEGNIARLDGRLKHQSFRDMLLNLKANTGNRFKVMNSSSSAPAPFYGKAYGQANIDISGPLSSLNVRVDAQSRPGSDVVIPIDFFTASDKDFFFTIVDDEAEDEVKRLSFIEEKAYNPTGIDLRVNLDIYPEDTKVQMIIGSNTQERIVGFGQGNISMHLSRRGEIEMFGNYTIEEGTYNFARMSDYGIVRRFVIDRGGSVEWSGDPIDAQIQLSAKYPVRTDPYNFVADIVATDQLRELASNVTDVDLILRLEGSLLAPDISFDFDFPDLTGQVKSITDQKKQIISQNESEAANQALSLMLAGRFTPPNSSANASASVLNTASDILTNYLSDYVTTLLGRNLFNEIDAITDYRFDFKAKNIDNVFSEVNGGGEEGGGFGINYFELASTLEFWHRLELTGRLHSDLRIQDQELFDLIFQYYLNDDRSLRLGLYNKYSRYYSDLQVRQKIGMGIGYSRSYDRLSEIWQKRAQTQATN